MEDRQTDLAKYRIEKAKDDLESARVLFENKKYSQSINRSYYSMFHSTRALLALDKFDSKKHTGIISYFNKNYIKTDEIETEYSKMLMDAMDYRSESDYDDYYVPTAEEAGEQLSNANLFYERIKKKLLEKGVL